MPQIIPISLVDWRDNSSISLFFSGCNMNCMYCHNKHLIQKYKDIDMNKAKDEILKSKPFINSVIFSGGEPTLHFNEIVELSIFSKNHNLKVGIHSNGLDYHTINHLLKLNIIDKWFIDYKLADRNIYRIKDVLGINKNYALMVLYTIRNIHGNNTPLEVRTTVFNKVHTPNDIKNIAQDLCMLVNEDIYYVIQQGNLNGDKVSMDKLKEYKKIANEYLSNVTIRTALGEEE